jgi:hypothetical protein
LLGAFDLYATDLEHAVLVETDAPPEHRQQQSAHSGLEPADRLRWIVTPDDPESFLEAMGGRRFSPR